MCYAYCACRYVFGAKLVCNEHYDGNVITRNVHISRPSASSANLREVSAALCHHDLRALGRLCYLDAHREGIFELFDVCDDDDLLEIAGD